MSISGGYDRLHGEPAYLGVDRAVDLGIRGYRNLAVIEDLATSSNEHQATLIAIGRLEQLANDLGPGYPNERHLICECDLVKAQKLARLQLLPVLGAGGGDADERERLQRLGDRIFVLGVPRTQTSGRGRGCLCQWAKRREN
jgi:hypothetical protein